MKVLALAIVNSLIAGLAMARDCPTESDCMQKSCKDFAINKHAMLPLEEWDLSKALLEAVCKDSRGKEVYTWLNLKECLRNVKAEGIWVDDGVIGCFKTNGHKAPIGK
ncbi:cvnh domain-containing protein [Colletotrichum sp. SAR 10_70]|nr:cvnh domain-containing protein [Colletotrichum sp. SAR 10_71]KAI8179837.1 cvnh domain-containing protein [Colletotrichum sp. SAR 10_70]KAI8217567.1 cvnh domain-containing protein [Colletotrichum sp. SAR 10_77]KAJ4996687.1 cvnh domain-containing protein [Colletotrichum sp. SAR 10_66]